MSNRKSRSIPASATAPVRKAAPKRAHGPRVVRLPSVKAKAAEASTAVPVKPVTPQIPAPGPHTIGGMRDSAPIEVKATPVAEAQATELPEAQTIRLSLHRIAALLAIAPTKEQRHFLNGIHIHQVGGELRMVATDGHRMLVLSQQQPEALAWGEKGIILPSVQLGQILKYTGKDTEATLTVSYGPGHPHATVAQGFGQFQVRPVDGTFPPYQKIFDEIGGTLSSEREPMQTAGLNAKYVKAAGAVSAALESEGLFFFPPKDERSATLFTFAGCPGAVLILMPIKINAPALSEQAVRMIGAAGMAPTLAALKAHATRNRKAAKEAGSDKDRERLEAVAKQFDDRVAAIMAGLKPALPAPTSAQEAAAA